MNRSIRFHSQVPEDLAEAIAWYQEVSADLANRFRRAARDAFTKIRTRPENYGIVFDEVRVVRLTRFPYLVQYRLHSEIPHVLGVFHAASNPDKWQKRARS